MKVYVAAPWVLKDRAVIFARALTSLGFDIEVTSRWFFHEGSPADSTGSAMDLATVQFQAREDIEDVLRSDYLVVLNLEKSEGKAVETGIALAMGIPVISVGVRSNIFQSLCMEIDTEADAIACLWMKML